MTKYEVKYTSSFKNDIKKFKKDEDALNEITDVIKKIANDEILDEKYKDHNLKGEYKEYRECHIRPNLLLVYKKIEDTLILSCVRVGSHNKIFKIY